MLSKILSYICITIMLLTVPLSGQDDNPFFNEWNTPFAAPPFDLIKAGHYMPAFEEGMKIHNKEIDAIINNSEEPGFQNTIEALEKSGQLLDRVSSIFYNLYSAHTSEELQKISMEIAPLLSKHSDDINLNEKLFERIKTIYAKKNDLNLTFEQMFLLEKYYKDFARRGANLNESDKEKFRKINEELSLLSLKFSENVLKETNSFELVIDNKDDLSGLPESAIAAASDEANKKGYDNKWLFTLNYPSYRPFVFYSDKRELREKMFKAYTNRGNNDNENDNKEIIAKIASLRYQRAKLLGYASHAYFTLDEYMAKTPETVFEFLDKLSEPSLKLAKKETEELQKLVYEEGKDFKLEPWDWSYYAEKLKKKKYDLDEEMLRPYFKMENVINGLFSVVTKLYGLQFEERKDIPVYQEDVKVFEVKDKDGSHIGIFYADYFPRETKRAGAWMNSFRPYSSIAGKKITPIIFNVGNLNKPTEQEPSLLTLDEVKTIFHEFGHGLHGLLSKATYPSVSGTNVAWDFVELPSQIMENWVTHPQVLKMFAVHYKTGEVIPDELIQKIDNAKLFNKGYETLGTYLIPSYLDMEYHAITEDKPLKVADVEAEVIRKSGINPEIGLRYKSTINAHIFAGGYSAGYYSYIWAEVLDADAFQAFMETGNIFDQKTAADFREYILSKGGSEDPMVLYKKFRGREPKVDALLVRRGLN